MWETAKAPQSPGFFIVQGLASTAIWDHYLTTRDTAFLRDALPALMGTAFATAAARKACGPGCNGLMPAGGGDGGQ